MELGPTKRKKVRTVDFCDTLAAILRKARKAQTVNRIRYGELYRLNYYTTVKEKNRTYYEIYSLPRTAEPQEGYTEVSFVCLRDDGTFVRPVVIATACRRANITFDNIQDFHFHVLRHTFTSNMIYGGASSKDVQELLGHSSVNTTMNIYAHAKKETKRSSARSLDKVVGEC